MVLFGDDFSADLSNWIPVSEAWEITDAEQLHVYARNGPALIKTAIGDPWTDYSVEALIVGLGGTYREAGFALRMLNDANYYRLIIATEEGGLNQIRRIYLHKVVNGAATEISPYRDVQYTCPLTLAVSIVDETDGTRITVYVNGEMVYSWLDLDKTFSGGRAGIYTDQYANFYCDNFVVESLLPTHFLSINTTPIGVPFDLGGQNMKTPWTGSLTEGTYVVTMPTETILPDGIYQFVQWEDGSTNPVRTLNLLGDVAIEATYEYVAPPPPTPPIDLVIAVGAPITVGLISWLITLT